MADDLLRTIRAEIEARLHELKPLLGEYQELSAVLRALSPSGEEPSSAGLSGGTRARGRARRPAASPARAGARGRVARGEAARGEAARERVARGEHADDGAAVARTTARGPARARAKTRGRSTRNPTDGAILAALEHGSHTVAELLVVTGLPARDIRESLRLLQAQRTILATNRDGKTAYALPGGDEGPG
jgi:hypothetical protein